MADPLQRQCCVKLSWLFPVKDLVVLELDTTPVRPQLYMETPSWAAQINHSPQTVECRTYPSSSDVYGFVAISASLDAFKRTEVKERRFFYRSVNGNAIARKAFDAKRVRLLESGARCIPRCLLELFVLGLNRSG
ncbi:hypothetical protein IRJ41_002849 [Triplophysa rosa]|uniref:Uncharacterized protein n=1 Tax=Triplophysa rosa TaxID=992332 RepID=A0A9W7WGC5_TRIRA|nr:hypothetical protein IRJ41_002849 [Triplophysa rosa]